LTGILILGISSKLKGIWDLFAIILFVLFGLPVPELGGTGYELNLFLQDYIGKTGTLLF
jgi:S-DNA-T family DNA segregation ATPase FtsK/SpoIIIE